MAQIRNNVYLSLRDDRVIVEVIYLCHCERSEAISMEEKQYYIYIMTNCGNTILYVGVTNNLIRRVFEHREKLSDGFTNKYNVTKLVYYEAVGDAYEAIAREKQIKGGSRQKKVDLIQSLNPKWCDLYEEIASSA